MRVLGIICEYNPFHRGHALHIARARALTQADACVCAMSGPFTQRGEPARHDKWTRARMALLGGADLVLELPARFACAAAPDFARGGVGLLAALGVVTRLSFGCEAEALPCLPRAAAALAGESDGFRASLRAHLGEGMSFPRARALALEEALGEPGLASRLDLPNAALALEYLRALPEGMQAVPVAREGGEYRDASPGALSASAVRAALERGDPRGAAEVLPFPEIVAAAEARGDFVAPGALDQAMLFALRRMTPEALARVPGVEEGLEYRLLRAAEAAGAREALLDTAKTKRYTRARLSRAVTLAALGVTKALSKAHPAPEYARVLGFRKSAAPLLSEIKRRARVPLMTKAADFDRTDPLFALDVRAQDLWALGCASPKYRAAGRDFTTGPVIL